MDIADRWRACYAYPINTFQATLRMRLRNGSYQDYIVAQRLKRMPKIVDKLRRYPRMKLSTMQDIGGVRAIVSSVDEVERLVSEYKNNSRFVHELVDEKDYIDGPRDDDGYRGIHLVYKYKNQKASNYNDLRIELQIRTRLQHLWATAVETMGVIRKESLKSRQGSQGWLDFFAIISSAFAHLENRNPVPRFAHLSLQEMAIEIEKMNESLGALEIMSGIRVAFDDNQSKKKWYYHLIILDSQERTVIIQPYDRDSISQALTHYSELEKEAEKGNGLEPVLVSAGPIDKLCSAYPNFFLDISEFAQKVSDIIDYK